MNGTLPNESDRRFVYNGWACAFGHSGDGADTSNMILVKEKVKGSNPTLASGWEIIYREDQFIGMIERDGKTAEQALEAWRVEANKKLKERLGEPDGSGSVGVPEIPVELFKRVLWFIRYGMDFRPETGEIVFK